MTLIERLEVPWHESSATDCIQARAAMKEAAARIRELEAQAAAVCSCGDHCQQDGSRCPVCVSELEAQLEEAKNDRQVLSAVCGYEAGYHDGFIAGRDAAARIVQANADACHIGGYTREVLASQAAAIRQLQPQPTLGTEADTCTTD